MSVRHALLALLSDGPKYGFRLREEFEAGTAEVWPLNAGQVYQALQRLERDGLVASEADSDGGTQKDFRLTDAGRDALEQWLAAPSAEPTPPRDELVMKVLIALRVGLDVRRTLQAHRRHFIEQMQKYTALKVSMSEGDLAMPLVVDAELFRLDGVVRWIDAAEARIVQRGVAS